MNRTSFVDAFCNSVNSYNCDEIVNNFTLEQCEDMTKAIAKREKRIHGDRVMARKLELLATLKSTKEGSHFSQELDSVDHEYWNIFTIEGKKYYISRTYEFNMWNGKCHKNLWVMNPHPWECNVRQAARLTDDIDDMYVCDTGFSPCLRLRQFVAFLINTEWCSKDSNCSHYDCAQHNKNI